MARTFPATVSLRLRSAAGGEGKIEWRATPQAAEATSVSYNLPRGAMQTVQIEISAAGPLGILRVYLPAAQQPVELDWIEVQSKADGKPHRWDY